MPSGSCACGKSKITYQGEPAMKALCHCTDCHKISGSTYSTNIVVSEEGFIESGDFKTWTKTADGGNSITSHFCANCGSTLFRDGASFPGLKVIKAGVLDDDNKFDIAKPDVELFAPKRAGWVPQTSGTEDKQAMP